MGLEFMPFLNNPIAAVAPPDHPLCKLERLRLQDLEPHTLLVREQGSGTRKACEEYFKDKRVHFSQTLRGGVCRRSTRVRFARCGLGIALLTRHALNLELATGVLRELPVEELPLYRSWCVWYRPRPSGKVAGSPGLSCIHPQRTRANQRTC